MMVHRYSVRKISTRSLAKFGCVLGGAAMTLPAILCAVVVFQVVAFLNFLFDSWQAVEADLLGLGAPIELDFVRLLGLEGLQTVLSRIGDQGLVMGLLVFLLILVGGGLLAALIILLVGWVYNLLAALSGGLEVELCEQPDT